MSRLFQPYEGKRPFLFVSYAHLNSETVVDTIRDLHDKHYRVWYDEGIPGGSDWPANIATHVRDCGAMLFFSSWRSLASPNCYSEVRTAVRLGKPLVIVPLDDTEPDSAWKELLDRGEWISGKTTPKEMATEILAGKTVSGKFREHWFETIPWRVLALAFASLFLIAAATLLWNLARGRLSVPADDQIYHPTPNMTPTPTPVQTPAPTVSVPPGAFVVSFPDTLQERAVRKELGMPDGDIRQWNLAEITELYFFGNMTVGSSEKASYKITFDENGICCVNGGKAGYITADGKKAGGVITDLSLFSRMVRLQRLALVWQPLETRSGSGAQTVASSLSSLNGLVLLEELDLSGSTVSDLSMLTDLPSLSVIRIEHTDVKDLRPLEKLTGLKTVMVSKDMLPLIWDDTAPFHILLTDR